MNAKKAIKDGLDMGEMVAMAYLGDLSDAEMMQRPHPQCNHLNWQVGHLIASEHGLMSKVAPGEMPDLPDGFEAKYQKEMAGSDDATQFANKEELMEVYKAQREKTLQILDTLSDADLDNPTGVEYAPTFGAMVAMQGAHWLMHCGQWVVVRRQNDKPVVI